MAGVIFFGILFGNVVNFFSVCLVGCTAYSYLKAVDCKRNITSLEASST